MLLDLEAMSRFDERGLEPNARSEQRATRAEQRLILLVAASRALAESGFDVDRVLQSLAEMISELIGDLCIVRLFDGDGENEYPLGVHGRDPAAVSQVRAQRVGLLNKRDRGLIAEVLRTGRTIFYPQLAHEQMVAVAAPEMLAFLERFPIYSLILAPLRTAEGIIGSLTLARLVPDHPYEQDDVALIEDLADRASLSINGARQHLALSRERERLSFALAEEQRSKEELRHVSDQLRLITDSIRSLVAYVDRNGRYRFANSAYRNWFGVSPSEIVGRPVVDVVGRESLARVQSFVDRALAGEEVTFEDELPYIHGARHVRARYVPHRDPSGRIVGFVGIVTDISAEKRVQDRERFLSEATRILSSSIDYEETLRALCNLAVPKLADWCTIEIKVDEGRSEQLAVAHIDPSKVELAHDLRRRYPPDRTVPRGVHEVMRTGVSELYREIPDELLVQAARDEQMLKILRDLGLRSAITVALRSKNKILGALQLVSAESGRLYDESDLKFAEELANRAAIVMENARLYQEARIAVQRRDEFLSIASHELRTPLTSLGLHVSALLHGVLSGRVGADNQQRLVDKLAKSQSQVERLAALIDRLLDVSRLASGGSTLVREDVDLRTVAEEVIERFEHESARARAPLVLQVDGEVKGRWDRGRIDQIITNLISNALKYGAGKPIEVTLRDRGETIELSVRDHGIGIKPTDQQRIFERFERTDAARNFGGLGLGLWIVREMTRAHNGTVTVESTPDRGASFVVELPKTPR